MPNLLIWQMLNIYLQPDYGVGSGGGWRSVCTGSARRRRRRADAIQTPRIRDHPMEPQLPLWTAPSLATPAASRA